MSAVFVVLATNLSDVVETLRQPFPVREGRGEKIDAFGLTYSDEHYIQSDKGMGTVIFQMPGATSRASGNGWSARRCCAGEGCCIIRGYPLLFSANAFDMFGCGRYTLPTEQRQELDLFPTSRWGLKHTNSCLDCMVSRKVVSTSRKTNGCQARKKILDEQGQFLLYWLCSQKRGVAQPGSAPQWG